MEELTLRRPDGVHTWGIAFYSENDERISQFVNVCNSNLDKSLNWFHQSGATPWGYENFQLFEFWTPYNDDIGSMKTMLENCFRIAELMSIKLKIQ